jgi:hypothetical protein
MFDFSQAHQERQRQPAAAWAAAAGVRQGDGILSDIRDEAQRLAALALRAGQPARLLGGLAIWLRCPSARSGPYARSYDDMDFAVASHSAADFRELLTGEGYVADRFFNGLHGASRLYFAAPDGRWSIDIVIDELTMSHRLDLRGRLDRSSLTITLADLLLSKLQVWEVNKKDLGDMLCVLADHTLGDDDSESEAISLRRVTTVLGADWGFCHTAERNLGKLSEQWTETPVASASFDVAGQISLLRQAIDVAPKTRAWRMRNRLGERVRWYQTPEEVGH